MTPAAEQTARVGIVPAWRRKIATNAASDRASAQRLTGLMLATRLNPLWILMTGGALGGLGLL